MDGTHQYGDWFRASAEYLGKTRVVPVLGSKSNYLADNGSNRAPPAQSRPPPPMEGFGSKDLEKEGAGF